MSSRLDRRREGYQKLLRDIRRKKIDLIIVKSLNLFGRDTLEIIKRVRKLKERNITIYSEVGKMNTMAIPNVYVEAIAALAREERRAKSENTRFGIRRSMRDGKVKLNHTQFLGYTKEKDGCLIMVPEEAEIVKKIFELYLLGQGCRRIKKYLEANGIKTITGKSEWSTSTIDRMLSNEKYVGNVLMQKAYTQDYRTGKQVKNNGELEMVLIESDHEPIIDEETFYIVQKLKYS